MIVERTSMGKAMKREHNPDWREGRKLKEIDNEQFEKLAQKQKNGIITVADCCRELGISRSTWYDRVGITVKTAQTRMNTGFLTCHFAL